jgi:hypothetical protein
MDGRVLASILTDGARERPIERAPEGERWPSDAEAVFVEGGRAEEGDDRVRERLRALGYVE